MSSTPLTQRLPLSPDAAQGPLASAPTWFSVRLSRAASWALFFPTKLCCFANTFSSSCTCSKLNVVRDLFGCLTVLSSSSVGGHSRGSQDLARGTSPNPKEQPAARDIDQQPPAQLHPHPIALLSSWPSNMTGKRSRKSTVKIDNK